MLVQGIVLWLMFLLGMIMVPWRWIFILLWSYYRVCSLLWLTFAARIHILWYQLLIIFGNSKSLGFTCLWNLFFITKLPYFLGNLWLNWLLTDKLLLMELLTSFTTIRWWLWLMMQRMRIPSAGNHDRHPSNPSVWWHSNFLSWG